MTHKSILKRKTLLLIGMFAFAYSAFAQTPYNIVMNIYDDPKTTMAFNWFTTSNTTGEQVEISIGTGTFTPFKTVSATTSQNVHKAVVTGLTPNTKYSFRVGKANLWSNIGTFTTAKANKDPFSFIYVTDTQVGANEFGDLKTRTDMVAANHSNAKFWLHCGDLIWTGSDLNEWNKYFTSQQNMFYHFPFTPVQGNHDFVDNNILNFKRHFNLNNTSFDSQGSTYTYIYGDVQFFALNSELYNNPTYISDISTWMQNEKNAHPDITWRIVYFHRSAYTAAAKLQHDIPTRVWRQAITPILDNLDIDLVLFGHDHVYEVIGPVKNKEFVQGSVSNVRQGNPVDPVNITGKSGGIFSVKEGTLYFNNNTFGAHQFTPFPFDSMPGKESKDIRDYPSLFTGMLGQNGKPTYSNVSVSTDAIIITTYEIVNGNSKLLDEIKVVKYCEPYTQGIVTYSSNQSFNNTTLIIGEELRVKNNATVTFTNSTLRFYQDAKVIIEPGSKLIINGGTLTASCSDKMWGGIVVFGDRTKPQIAQYQGTVELNGGIIEHAADAISAAPTGYYNRDGGIIKATNTIFRNNWRAIEYCSYENTNAGGTIIADNVGKFVNCTFVVNDNKRFSSFKHHVTMWEVRGVTFQACTFENNTTRPRLKEGISTVDAGFKVINKCPNIVFQGVDCTCPLSNTEPCTFSKFDNGIHSVSAGASPRSIYIDQSNFDQNNTCVRMEEQPNFRLTRCNFTNFDDFGLVSVNSSGYRIEENVFTKSTTSNITPNGIRMSNSGNAANRIYKNYFNNLHQGIFIHGVNGSTTQGLQFLCNAFDGNKYDVHIWNSTTVRPNQGSLSAGADNTFKNTQTSSIQSQSATSAQTITYYRRPPSVRPDPYEPYNPTSNIIINRNATFNSCASTFCTPGGTETKSDTDNLEQYKAMQAQYDYLLANLEDNPELLQDLLVLSDAMRELSDHAISRILQDSILYLDALKSWYEVVRTPIAKYWLSEVYASEKKYEQAEAILREIPVKFAFSESELPEHENYMRFYNFKKQMLLSGRNWTQLDEAEIAQLQHIAEATQGRSAGMAKGVLCFFYDICYEDKIEEGGEGESGIPPKSAEVESPTNGIQDHNYELSIYPNPTQSEIAIVTNNPAVKIVQTEIYDFTNRKVHQQTVNQSYSALKLNDLAQGVYILKVWLDNGDMVVRKVVKQ